MGGRVQQTWRYLLDAGADQRHAERTAELLRSWGADDELVTAGLLHDLAKPSGTRLWHRIAGVLLERGQSISYPVGMRPSLHREAVAVDD